MHKLTNFINSKDNVRFGMRKVLEATDCSKVESWVRKGRTICERKLNKGGHWTLDRFSKVHVGSFEQIIDILSLG